MAYEVKDLKADNELLERDKEFCTSADSQPFHKINYVWVHFRKMLFCILRIWLPVFKELNKKTVGA